VVDSGENSKPGRLNPSGVGNWIYCGFIINNFNIFLGNII